MENENFREDKFREILQKTITNRVSTVGKDLIEFRTSFQQSAQTIIDHVSQILNTVEDELLLDLRNEIATIESGMRGKVEGELRGQLENELRQKMEAEWQPRLGIAKESGIHDAEEKLQSKMEILNNALHEVSLQNSQVEILTSYLDKASLFASRVALFVMKSGNLLGWQARGFEGDFNNASIKSVIFLPEHSNILRHAAESRQPFTGTTSSNPETLELVSRFGPMAPEIMCALPLVVRDKAVAVLYADSGVGATHHLDEHALKIVSTVVSLTVELSSARTKLGVKPAEGAPHKAVASERAAEEGEVSRTARPSFESPVMPPAETLHHEAPLVEHVHTTPPPAPEVEEEIAAAPVAPAPPPVQAPAPEIAAQPQAGIPTYAPFSPDHLSADEQKLHNDARRFARLLVSEIKLYNEQKVHAGRRDKNLYLILRDDIDKSREMYDKRVSPDVAAKVDYFHDELVKILAENEPSSLGAECPGPVILARH
ncbi:MAG: hypothetical protein U0V70_03305 [Terriglobia bacterium]